MVTRDPDRIPWNEQKYQQSVVDTVRYVCCRPLLIGIREYHRMIVSVEAKARQVFSPHCRPSGDIFFPLRYHGHQAVQGQVAMRCKNVKM